MHMRLFLAAMGVLGGVLGGGSVALADLPSGGQVLVLGVNGSLSARDPSSLKTSAQGPETGALALSGDRKHLFGMESAVGRVFEINVRTLAVTPVLELKQPLSGICANPDGSRLLLSSLGQKSLYLVDTIAKHAAPVPVEGKSVRACQFSADGTHAYVIPAEADSILIIDLKANKLIDKVAIASAQPSSVTGLFLHPNPAKKQALIVYDTKVGYLDTSTHKLVGAETTFDAPIQTVVLAPDGAHFYALAHDKLFLVDLQSRKVQKTVELLSGALFRTAAIDPQGKRLYVSGNHETYDGAGAILNRDGKEFATIDLETGKKTYQAFPPVQSVLFIVTP